MEINQIEDKETLISGQIAFQQEFPFSVSLRYRNMHFCGGSLITANRVLTAAHCLMDFGPGSRRQVQDITVVTGTNLLTGSPFGAEFEVESIHPHENFRPELQLNDIGIVKVSFTLIL